MNCLSNIIGLTSKNYTCWNVNKPEGFDASNASLSGFFVDCVEWSPDLNNRSDLYNLLLESRDEGLSEMITHIGTALQPYTNSKVNYVNDIAGAHRKATYPISTYTRSKAGVVICPTNYAKGANIKITKVHLWLDKSGTYNVYLYDIDNGVIIDNIDITTNAKKLSSNMVNWSIGLSDRAGCRSYALVYDRDSASPYDIQTHCGCGDDPHWWKNKLISVNGFEVDEDIQIKNDVNSSYTSGISFEFTFECNPLGWLCDIDTSWFANDSLGRTIALTSQQYANIKLISKIIDTNKPSAQTILDQDTLREKRRRLYASTEQLVRHIAREISTNEVVSNLTDCVICRPSHGITINEISI